MGDKAGQVESSLATLLGPFFNLEAQADWYEGRVLVGQAWHAFDTKNVYC